MRIQEKIWMNLVSCYCQLHYGSGVGEIEGNESLMLDGVIMQNVQGENL
jgi:hypothetical protein